MEYRQQHVSVRNISLDNGNFAKVLVGETDFDALPLAVNSLEGVEEKSQTG